MLEFLFNKVAGLHGSNFIRKRHENRYFPVNIAKFFRTPTLRTSVKAASYYVNLALFFEKICYTEYKKSTILSRVSLLF